MRIDEWLAPRVPAHWGTTAVEVAADQDEILIVVDLGGDCADPVAAGQFRESSREERVHLARLVEEHFGRKVSWGVRIGGTVVLFTTLSVPVMTRLRLRERLVLDTLIDAGVARTRSEALAWCVRLVGENEAEWIAEMRQAFEAVHEVRQKGPQSRRTANGG